MKLAVALAVVAAALPAASLASSTPPCTGSNLTGSFAGVPGSAGAGNILYNLRLRNRSSSTCFVSGQAGMQLIGRYGRRLPTHVRPSHPGALTAVRVVLRPGAYTAATARFSPDIPGVGEPVSGRSCELPAYRVRVTVPPSGTTLVVPVLQPTPVCEHGSMTLSVLIAGRNGPDHA